MGGSGESYPIFMIFHSSSHPEVQSRLCNTWKNLNCNLWDEVWESTKRETDCPLPHTSTGVFCNLVGGAVKAVNVY